MNKPTRVRELTIGYRIQNIIHGTRQNFFVFVFAFLFCLKIVDRLKRKITSNFQRLNFFEIAVLRY